MKKNWQIAVFCFIIGALVGSGISINYTNNFISDGYKKESVMKVVNINTCDILDIKELETVGDKKALDIVKNRPYKNKREILEKNIVGYYTYKKIKDSITVGDCK